MVLARMNELKAENARLKKMFIEEKLKSEILNEAITKKVVRPYRRREMAQQAVSEFQISIKLAGISLA